MAAASSLIPELDDIIKRGSPGRRAEAVERIADLFLQGASRFEPHHVGLFDDILTGLLPATTIATRAALAERLSPLDNAPPTLIQLFAREDEIVVAGPVLRRSPLLDEPMLVEIARSKGQAHLAALAERPLLTAPLTDVILRRGEREIVRALAENGGAQFSEASYRALVSRAASDGVLALAVGQRHDISPEALKELLSRSVDLVRRRLFDVARPERKAAINKAMVEISGAPKASLVKRDFAPAQRAILDLHRAGQLNEAALLGFARAHKYEEAVAALSAMSGVRLGTVDRLVIGERHDPILILCRSMGFEWATVRALIVLRLGPGKIPSGPDIDEARANYDRLSQSTAQRVLAFWRSREKALA